MHGKISPLLSYYYLLALNSGISTPEYPSQQSRRALASSEVEIPSLWCSVPSTCGAWNLFEIASSRQRLLWSCQHQLTWSAPAQTTAWGRGSSHYWHELKCQWLYGTACPNPISLRRGSLLFLEASLASHPATLLPGQPTWWRRRRHSSSQPHFVFELASSLLRLFYLVMPAGTLDSSKPSLPESTLDWGWSCIFWPLRLVTRARLTRDEWSQSCQSSWVLPFSFLYISSQEL